MARTQTVTILFCDLVASTERRARLGDDAFDDFSRRYIAALEDAIEENNGRNIASAGDGLMVVFQHSVADAIACATTMHRAAAALDPHDPPLLRIGISSGEVAEDGDGYSGMPIVEAARLEAAAAPGQTLAHAIVRTLVGTRRAFRFRDVGPLTLKGIPAPVAAVQVIDDEVLEAPTPTGHTSAPGAPKTSRTRLTFIGSALAVVVVTGIAVYFATRSDSTSHAIRAAVPGIPAPTGYTPKYTSAPCPARIHASAADAKCGHLVVPQDRSKPGGRQISLLVSSAPPRNPGPTTDPTVDVCGCEDLGNSLARDHSQLIHIAIRGFVDSEPELTCPEMSAARIAALTKPALDPGEITRSTAAMHTCHDRLVRSGIDPAQYNPLTAAQDVTDLMYALKVKRANFVAFQDVDIEVFDILRRFPGAVRSLTLDNPPPPGTTDLTDLTGDFSGAFNRYVALCNADAICAKAYPDLRRTWQAAFSDIATRPQVVPAANPNDENAPPVSVLLDGTRGADGLAIALTDPQTYALIPAAIAQTTGESAAASEAVRADYPAPGEPWGAEASFGCAYDVRTLDRQAQALEGRTLPQFVRSNLAWPQWCSVWPVPDISAALSQPIVSDVPVLMFRGDINPDGNPSWIPTIERGMSNAQSVIFRSLGRDLLSNGPPCLSALRRQFLADPAAKLDTAACAAKSPAIEFVAPS